ncbi:MAG: MurT ligase domain-containing protein [Corynebacterium sp.]|nr:MurT ligase domain-containing protein [Corynebacterium sp.]
MTGRGAGGMIGGLVAGAIDPRLMANLNAGRPAVLVTGTNGKSTTTRMIVSALRTHLSVATNPGGDNMDAGIISALMEARDAELMVLECDELHVPHVAERLGAQVLVLLNLSRDQLDRVGEINTIEKRLRDYVNSNPELIVIANCDDMMVSSVAYDCPNVIWVSVGTTWHNDANSCPRTGGAIIREGKHWRSAVALPDGRVFERPTPTWEVDAQGIHHEGTNYPLNLTLPGAANRGNAAQAIATAVEVFDIPIGEAMSAVEAVDDVAGRYSTIDFEQWQVHMLLAKNPAGWQEALSMVDRSADGLVIAVNGQVADGQDLSWIWDVKFEDFENLPVVASGERGTDLAVRLTYAEVSHTLHKNPIEAIRACPPGRVELLANYTAFRDIRKKLKELTND